MSAAANGRPAPLPYPNGRFCVGRVRELPPGRVRTARLTGEDVVPYRTRRGAVRAVGPFRRWARRFYPGANPVESEGNDPAGNPVGPVGNPVGPAAAPVE
ncbi:hypothetical protein ACIRD3_20430 [Kitasatospora sp. NPDC093550]|uniref:hypothetical protein n=1 Tax=Kitasatospora sp. NPDC093550 TaxID=3364089 RepID=UPI00381CF4A9